MISFAFAASAGARDSNAPKGAGDRWLPCKDWVMLHWIPYDESDFAKLTGYTSSEVLDWIRDDQHHTLGQLVTRKGVTIDDAVDKLTAPRVGKVSDAKLAVLKQRTHDMLTQGHLSQHVLFHHFHAPLIAANSRKIFNLGRGDYTLARRHGYTPAQMGRHTHRNKHQIKVAVLRVMRIEMHKAIARDEIAPAEAHRFYRRQVRYTHRWMNQNLKLAKKGKFPKHHKAKRFAKKQELYCSLFVSKRNDGSEPEAAPPPAEAKP